AVTSNKYFRVMLHHQLLIARHVLVAERASGSGFQAFGYRSGPLVPAPEFLLQNTAACALRRPTDRFDISIHHDANQFLELDTRLPSQFPMRFARISQKELHLGGA